MTAAPALPRPSFAHASEAELARILDFYQVRWEYEPVTFPIGWSMAGDVVESFAPDFYLPDMDLYVELTTLKQKLVRKKNRKLRRLRELYPDIRIKLFYARDFRMLLLKFGRLALLDELSGTVGQATPPRPADLIVLEAGGLLPEGATTHGRSATDAHAATDAGVAAGTGTAADMPGMRGMTGVDPVGLVAPTEPGAHVRSHRRGRRRRRGTGAPATTDATLVVAPADGFDA